MSKCKQDPCPHCDPRGFLTAVARVVNLVEGQGLTEDQITERVTYILEGNKTPG